MSAWFFFSSLSFFLSSIWNSSNIPSLSLISFRFASIAQKQCVLLKDMSSLMFGDYMNPDGDADERVYEEVSPVVCVRQSAIEAITLFLYRLQNYILAMMLSTWNALTSSFTWNSLLNLFKFRSNLLRKCTTWWNNASKNTTTHTRIEWTSWFSGKSFYSISCHAFTAWWNI